MSVSSIPLTEVEAWELMSLEFEPELLCDGRLRGVDCPNPAEVRCVCRHCPQSALACNVCVSHERRKFKDVPIYCRGCKAEATSLDDLFRVLPLGGSHE